jgi:hypothetical protein
MAAEELFFQSGAEYISLQWCSVGGGRLRSGTTREEDMRRGGGNRCAGNATQGTQKHCQARTTANIPSPSDAGEHT